MMPPIAWHLWLLTATPANDADPPALFEIDPHDERYQEDSLALVVLHAARVVEMAGPVKDAPSYLSRRPV